jgi:hypothetical protein
MKKTRLTRNTSGTVFHRLFSKSARRAYTWAMNLKPGDVFNSFDAWNHVVERIEILWKHAGYTGGMNRETKEGQKLRVPAGTYVYDVVIYSTNGWSHCISERGCIVPAWSEKELIECHGKNVFDRMKELGIIDPSGIRLRSATDDEKNEIEHLYNHNNEQRKNAKESSF